MFPERKRTFADRSLRLAGFTGQASQLGSDNACKADLQECRHDARVYSSGTPNLFFEKKLKCRRGGGRYNTQEATRNAVIEQHTCSAIHKVSLHRSERYTCVEISTEANSTRPPDCTQSRITCLHNIERLATTPQIRMAARRTRS